MYFVLTDRFLDGDPANNMPEGSASRLYDAKQRDITRYHGGDFRGLELALESGYFNDLGITAIWITPPVRNVWNASVDAEGQPKTGYHGYWTQDFLDIDPHLTSRSSLDGTRTYPDSRDGRIAHYRDLVALAHRKGIRIIQDIVCNHAGPVFYYDANANGNFDREDEAEWLQPFRHRPYQTAHWAETPQWNQSRTAPQGPVTILGHALSTTGLLSQLATYSRRGMSAASLSATDGEEILCDFISLRTLDTAPTAPHFDALVQEFVEIYAFYLEGVGVDGFRIDTVKHVHHAFWDAFTERLRERVGPERASSLFLFGEIYDGNPRKLGQYTYRSDWPEHDAPCLDSVLNFQLCYAIRSYLRTPHGTPGNAQKIVSALSSLSARPAPRGRRPYYNQTPGADGLNASQKIINFFENHDGINRFLVREVPAMHNRLANALLLTLPGIPCLYYGTEANLSDPVAAIGENIESGRLTFIPAGKMPAFDALRQQESYRLIAALAKLRQQYPALSSGTLRPLWIDGDTTDDDGIFAFACHKPNEATIVVVLNASDKASGTGSASQSMKLVDANSTPLLAAGDCLEELALAADTAPRPPCHPDWHDGSPEIRLTVPPQAIALYRIRKQIPPAP